MLKICVLMELRWVCDSYEPVRMIQYPRETWRELWAWIRGRVTADLIVRVMAAKS